MKSTSHPATLSRDEIERFRRSDILLSDEQVERFCDLAISALSETPRSAAVESLIGQLRKHVSHNVCEDAWYSCAQADCVDDRRAGHPCDCGAQHLNELHAHAADALERTVSATPCSDPDWKVDSAPLHWPYSEREAWKGGYYAAMTLYKVHKERA